MPINKINLIQGPKLYLRLGKLIFGGMHEIYYRNLDFQDAEFLDTCV